MPSVEPNQAAPPGRVVPCVDADQFVQAFRFISRPDEVGRSPTRPSTAGQLKRHPSHATEHNRRIDVSLSLSGKVGAFTLRFRADSNEGFAGI
jgi:hypothetical protein